MRASTYAIGTFMFSTLVAAGASCGGGGGNNATGVGVGGATTTSHGSGAGTTTSSSSTSGLTTTSSSSGKTTTSSSSGTTTTSSSSTGSSTSTTTSSSTGSSSSSGATTTSSSSTGSSSSGVSFMPDAGPVQPFPFPPVTYQGGPIVKTPKVYTITYPSDTMASQLQSFGSSVLTSSYWDAIRAGYCDMSGNCIGQGTNQNVALTANPATVYTDSSQGGASTLQTYISGLITAGTLPMPDANTIYAFYFPLTTTITLDGSKSCQAFDGYHNSLMFNGMEVYYAIIPECKAPMMTPTITTLQNTTITASHELIETASDGSLQAFTYALDLSNPATYGWADVSSIEIGDLCVDPFGLGQDEATENTFTVQRIWNATQANMGKNPCVPVPAGEVYFNTYSTYSVVTVDIGKSIDIEIDALADGAMGAWNVLPQDWTDFSNPNPNPYLSFAIQGGTFTDAGPVKQMKSGDKAVLTITLTADPLQAPYGEADGVIISVNSAKTAAHWWPFIVLTPSEAADAGLMMMAKRGQDRLQRRMRYSKGIARDFWQQR